MSKYNIISMFKIQDNNNNHFSRVIPQSVSLIKLQPFKNSILIISFNYSNTVKNKDKLIDLYKNYFKKIIIYSDYPVVENIKNVNYVDTQKGVFTHRIFSDFKKKYEDEILNIDGLFYTMDDNIINVNILNLYSNKKIIYYYQELHELNFYSDWHWDKYWGKKAINKMHFNDELSITKFSGKPSWRHAAGIADWFYLPKKYLTNKLYNLFDIFSNVHLEIAIPTVINNLETCKNEYCKFTDDQKDYNNRNLFLNKNNIYKSLNYHHNLIIHPIKFNSNPKALGWLSDIFQKKKCVIITTINPITETIKKHMNNTEYDVIIIGDKKTPDCYKNENCIYLDIEAQDKFFPKLSKLIPYNHYGRKNLGYLFAIQKGYEIIYETDDDNIPFDNFDSILDFDKSVKTIQENDSEWINIFKYFTNNNWIWPRGYPLSLIKKHPIPNYTFENSNKNVAIINGLVENDPDVDALFRLISNNEVTWEKNKKIIISNKNVCVFNTQNTFWIDSTMFIGLLLPCSVTFRYCDILKGIIANILLKFNDKNMAYTSPNVTQLRNEHDLIKDFESEYSMYIANEKILNIIDKTIEPPLKCIYLIQASGRLPDIYNDFKNNSEYVLLSYKNNTEETDIFFPNSTWTTGRNKLREYALKLKNKYDYYIFMDEDIEFTKPTENFKSFEKLLNKYRPYIGNPYLINYSGYNKIPKNSDAYHSIFYDGICNAFSNEAFNDNIIFPYIDKFDNENWGISQYIMIILCSVYEREVIVFKNLKIKNNNHSDYPKSDIWKKAEDFILQKIKSNNPSLNLKWKIKNNNNKPISKIYQKKILYNIYRNLFDSNIITQLDMDICQEWLTYF